MRTIALIPAYRPDTRMVTLVDELVGHGLDVVVVDDGSGEAHDATFAAVRGKATVLAHPANRGKGMALKTGLEHIAGAYASPYVVVTADADGQHLATDVLRVAEVAAANPHALVLGSRTLDKDAPARSRLGNAVTRRAFQLVTGARVRDTQTGLRAFGDAALPWMLAVAGSRYEYEMNVLLGWAAAGGTIREVDIETVYVDGNRASHFDVARDSARVCRCLGRFALPTLARFAGSSFACFALDYALFCLLGATFAALAVPTALAVVLANVTARVASATANYRLNRDVVFAARGGTTRSATRYALLACAVLSCNTALLGALVTVGANPYATKLVVEATMFLVSFAAQRTLVFAAGGSGEDVARPNAFEGTDGRMPAVRGLLEQGETRGTEGLALTPAATSRLALMGAAAAIAVACLGVGAGIADAVWPIAPGDPAATSAAMTTTITREDVTHHEETVDGGRIRHRDRGVYRLPAA